MMQDVNERLIAAANNGLDEEVNRLLDEGADINYVSRVEFRHCTALGFAIHGNHAAVIRSLLARGANCEIENTVPGNNNELLCANALVQTIKTKKPSLFKLLIQGGADYYAEDYCAALLSLEPSVEVTEMVRALLAKLRDDGVKSLAEYREPHFRLAKSHILKMRQAELLHVADMLYKNLLSTAEPSSPRSTNESMSERDAVKRRKPFRSAK
jgi:hypothetical protein